MSDRPPNMSDVARKMDEAHHDDPEVHLGLDYGTSSSAVAVQFRQGENRLGDPFLVDLINNSPELPMKVAWKDGRLIQGDELVAELEKDTDLGDKIVDHFKLCLYPGPQVAKTHERVANILKRLPGEITSKDVITEQLIAIKNAVQQGIRSSPQRLRFAPEVLDRMLERPHLRIAIPQMWTVEAQRQMSQAAPAAGFGVSPSPMSRDACLRTLWTRCTATFQRGSFEDLRRDHISRLWISAPEQSIWLAAR